MNRWPVILLLCAAATTTAAVAALDPAPPPPPALARGARTEESAQHLKERLDRVHAQLLAALTRDAPDLAATLEPPKVARPGYQLLPPLTDAPPRPGPPPRARVSAYSWPWTETRIANAGRSLDEVETALRRASATSAGKRRAALETAVERWRPLPEDQRIVDAHVGYNRLWQGEVVRFRDRYDRQTALLQAVLDRQRIQDVLRSATSGDLEPLRTRESELTRLVRGAMPAPVLPPFTRVERVSPDRWVVRVPVVTDIEDPAFIARVKDGIETRWRVTEGGVDYRVELEIRRITPGELYAKGGGAPPARGASISLKDHCARFPRDSAALTTGAGFLHVSPGWCVALGPESTSLHVLAHEAGHLLGFADVYFRGYRDLGTDGFEIQEVVADPDDIMGSPGDGPVGRWHFEALTEAANARR